MRLDFSRRLRGPRASFALAALATAALITSGFAYEERESVAVEGTRVQALVRTALAEGRIAYEDYLLENFRLAFAPEKASAEFVRSDARLDPCFTPWIADYNLHRDRLSAAAIAEIESYLRHSSSGLRAIYISPSGKFRLNYDTAGSNAVPSTDTTPANGIPDYVEMCANFYDGAWAYEIDLLGFAAPLLNGDGVYECYFEALTAGLFGFTSPAGGGRTEITVDNDFTGVGHVFSNDPDGVQAGRAKGVIAHEFKHASQYSQSGWSEGNWLELDANWIMDIVYDTSNIYLAWLGDPTSQLSSPQTTLTDDGGAGYYEDLIWETYLGEKHGVQFLIDFGARRAAHPTENVKTSYSQVLQAYGSTWEEAYPEYMEWCWFTGSRAETGVGFQEAATMQRMNLITGNISTYPYNASGSVNELAANARRFNPGIETGFPRVVFNGDDAHCCWTVSILVREISGTVTITHPTLNATNDCDVTLPTAFPNVLYVGVILTNTQRGGGVKSYTLDVTSEAGPTDAVVMSHAPEAGPMLATARPNPFRASTRLEYSMPQSAPASVRIYDVHGRLVRVLAEGMLEAGAGVADWDGRDSAGTVVPAGIYWSRLETPWGRVSQKMTLIR